MVNKLHLSSIYYLAGIFITQLSVIKNKFIFLLKTEDGN